MLSNEYIRKIHLITEEYDGETLSNNKEKTLSLMSMMEKLFQITRKNLVVDEYDGEILTNDKVGRSQHCNLTLEKLLQMMMAKMKQ